MELRRKVRRKMEDELITLEWWRNVLGRTDNSLQVGVLDCAWSNTRIWSRIDHDAAVFVAKQT